MYARQHSRRAGLDGECVERHGRLREHGGDDELERRERLEQGGGAPPRGRHRSHVLAGADALAVGHDLAHLRRELIPALGRHDLPVGGALAEHDRLERAHQRGHRRVGDLEPVPHARDRLQHGVEDRAQLEIQHAHGRLAQHADARAGPGSSTQAATKAPS